MRRAGFLPRGGGIRSGDHATLFPQNRLGRPLGIVVPPVAVHLALTVIALLEQKPVLVPLSPESTAKSVSILTLKLLLPVGKESLVGAVALESSIRIAQSLTRHARFSVGPTTHLDASFGAQVVAEGNREEEDSQKKKRSHNFGTFHQNTRSSP